MSHAKIRATFPDAVKPRKLSQIKDKDEKRFLVNDAVHTLRRLGEIEREVSLIKSDTELFDAAKAVLEQEMADTKKTLKTS